MLEVENGVLSPTTSPLHGGQTTHFCTSGLSCPVGKNFTLLKYKAYLALDSYIEEVDVILFVHCIDFSL